MIGCFVKCCEIDKKSKKKKKKWIYKACIGKTVHMYPSEYLACLIQLIKLNKILYYSLYFISSVLIWIQWK